MTKKIKLRIVYKSGHVQDVTVSDWSVQREPSTQEITGYDLPDCDPRPAYIGLPNIESIWRL